MPYLKGAVGRQRGCSGGRIAPYFRIRVLRSEIPEAAHQSLLHRQRQYLLAGGMPEAVLVLQETGSLVEAAAVHRRIISTYQDDFAKYAHRDRLALLQRVFLAIPRQVGQKVKYVSYSRESPARDVREALDLLTKARVCHRVPSSHCSGVPLHADINENVSKLLLLDVGLMNHVCGLDWTALREMSDLTLVNEGAIAEQLIGQHLVHASGGLERPSAVYWLREGRSSNAEVDFVISHGTEVVPVEVKAGRSGSLRSLHQLMLAGKATRAVRFDTNRPSRQIVQVQAPTGSGWRDVSYELLSLPLYAVGELSRLLAGEAKQGAPR